MDWVKILKAIAPNAKAEIVDGLAAALPKLIEQHKIDTPLRQAHFLAQLAHESDHFKTTVEYASGDAYDTRTDLGNTAARDGDGRLYKGYGLIQMTGKANQERAAKELGILAEWKKNPRILAQFPYAALSAGLYWSWRGLNEFADRDDVRTVTKKINGGLNGFNDRKIYLARAKKALGIEGSAAPAGDVLPREKVKSLQAQLVKLGYKLGNIDGIVGTQTVGAISAFQHDNELPITGKFDKVTEDALFTADPKPIPKARAEGVPADSTIVKNSSVLEKAAGTAIAVGGAITAIEPISQIKEIADQVTGLKAAFKPFLDLLQLPQDHWSLTLVILAGLVLYFANKIKKARIADHQSGKTI